jgi:hypothetical protein
MDLNGKFFAENQYMQYSITKYVSEEKEEEIIELGNYLQ